MSDKRSDKSLIERFNLRSKLKFDVERGHIWLGENRMLLFHAKALSATRRELFELLGPERARGVMLRMGFVTGRADADLACTLLGDETEGFDVFSIGPELHGFEGIVKSAVTHCDIDWERGLFTGRVELRGSWEAESHVEQFGVGTECACWSVTGHASGYVSQFFKRFIVFREVECVAKGDECCILIAEPAENMGDDPYLDAFRGEEVSSFRRMEAQLAEMRGPAPERPPPGRLVGASPGFRAAFDKVAKAANSRISVLLLGETGVGKEMFARWLHESGDRADKPFLAVNCGAIPHDLIESELFGVRRGAYTGAEQSRPGRFERADGGTILLDEVGDLTLAAQVKLLRVLQSGEVERLGDDQVRKVDVRLIAATNVDLKKAIAEGRFRADLYYRLATFPVEIPPLRERAADIPVLAAAMVEKYEPVYRKKLKGFSGRALQALRDHDWPGNVRELENLIERAVLLAPEGGMIEVGHLFMDGPAMAMVGAEVDRSGTVGGPADRMAEARLDDDCARLLDGDFDLQAHEDRLLRLATERAGGNLVHAARLLGITRRQLAYRLKRGEREGEA